MKPLHRFLIKDGSGRTYGGLYKSFSTARADIRWRLRLKYKKKDWFILEMVSQPGEANHFVEVQSTLVMR